MSNRADGADPKACEVMEFWFGDKWATCGRCFYERGQGLSKWFQGGPAVDEEIKSKFTALRGSLLSGELDAWLEHPTNALAGVIVMDQFSRNMFRGTKEMYDADAKSLAWAKVIDGSDLCDSMPLVMRSFVVFPFEHSEDLADQQKAVAMCLEFAKEAEAEVEGGDVDAPDLLKLFKLFHDYARRHLDVVEKWGRFPHRNAILGRESTPEEVEGMANKTIPAF